MKLSCNGAARLRSLRRAIRRPENRLPGESRDLIRSWLRMRPHVHRLAPPFQRLELPASSPPLCLVTVDTEESFDWRGPFRRDSRDVSNLAEQGRAQEICARFGAPPLYLTDWAVARDAASVRLLGDWAEAGLCEIGAHLHPWITPPHEEGGSSRESFAGNLPLALERAKLTALTRALEEAFGRRPRAYRAGRYGLGRRTAGLLRELGYGADLSATPRRSFAAEGGPDFSRAPEGPFWLDGPGGIVEIPTTEGVAGFLGARHGEALAGVFDSPLARSLRLPALLARSGAAERIRLSPEGTRTRDLRRLARALRARGERVFVVSYHSSSLQVGGSPYAPDAAARDALLRRLEEILTFLREEMGAGFPSASALEAALRAAPLRSAAPSSPAGEAAAHSENLTRAA